MKIHKKNKTDLIAGVTPELVYKEKNSNPVSKKLKLVRGFTLIELLVVIAIIGILSSIILASLNSARDKGANAAVKQNLDGIRSRAEVYYDDNGLSYLGLCDDPNIQGAIDSAINAGGDIGATVSTRCNATADEWAINIMLKVPENSGADVYWCVDGQSKGKGETNELAGATTCS